MAQINQSFPTLETFYGDKAFGAGLSLDRFNQAMQSGELNQQQALQDMFQSGEKHPLEMQVLRDRSAAAEAQLPGIVADSSIKGMEASDMGGLGGVFRQDVQRGKGQETITKGKEREFAHKAMELYASGDPVKQKQATQMFHALEAHETIKQQAIQERALALENQRHKNAMERDTKFGRFRPSSASMTSDDTKKWLKNPVAFAQEKESEAKTEEDKAYWAGMVQAYKHPALEKIERAAAAAAAARGNIDTAEVADLPRPVVPLTPEPAVPSRSKLGPGTMAPNGPTVATPKLKPQDEQAKQWATQNPNDPRAIKIMEKLKAIYGI